MSLNLLSSMARNISRMTPVYTRSLQVFSKPTTRSLWNLVQPANAAASNKLLTTFNTHNSSCLCSACRARGVHTNSQAESELIEFLTEEIAGEKANKKNGVPMTVNDFKIEVKGSEMTFSKKMGNEQVKVVLNVNLSVDTDHPEQESPDAPQTLNSKPPFTVTLTKGSRVLQLRCNFVLQEQTAQEQPSDFFYIDDLTVYEGELSEETYTVAADILDEYMYDLLMNLLEEKGMSNAFAEKICDIATEYEHDLYTKFLENMKSFINTK